MNFLSFDDATRLIRIRERLRNATYHELRKDGHHKSSEGAVSISFHLPPVVGGEEQPSWCVEVFSYVLCPDARSKVWTGQTATEAIGKAEDDVRAWCFPSEMEQFEETVCGEDHADSNETQEPPQ